MPTRTAKRALLVRHAAPRAAARHSGDVADVTRRGAEAEKGRKLSSSEVVVLMSALGTFAVKSRCRMWQADVN